MQCEYRVKTVEPLDSPERISREWLAAAGVRGLQCGSGASFRHGCLNIDAAAITDADGVETPTGRVTLCDHEYFYLRHDAKDRFPLDDACAAWVYAEHFIEHLEPKQAIAWLSEVRRLLKPGGFVRISTPDLGKYMRAYCNPSDCFFRLHGERLRAVGLPQPANRRAWMVNQIFYFWGHRWLYDLEELTYAAAAAGFPSEHITQVAFREGQLREVADFDMDLRNDESLYVEIIKPRS